MLKLVFMNELLGPMRKRRAQWQQDPDAVIQVLKQGSARTNEVAAKAVKRVKEAFL